MRENGFQVEFLETASQIPIGLWDACFQPPAEGRWWYEALDQSGIEDQFTFLYALINHFGSPVGIAPAFFMDVPVDQVAAANTKKALPRMSTICNARVCVTKRMPTRMALSPLPLSG